MVCDIINTDVHVSTYVGDDVIIYKLVEAML